jgi:hypothetical protein
MARERGIRGTTRGTAGRFSLAGAQPRNALFEEDGCRSRPRGRTPTNRTLEPPSREHRGFAENERFCLGLTGQLGLCSVESRVRRFEGEIVIVVDRFDRARSREGYRRIHQEDVCRWSRQALTKTNGITAAEVLGKLDEILVALPRVIDRVSARSVEERLDAEFIECSRAGC